jgi:hypothetical protein
MENASCATCATWRDAPDQQRLEFFLSDIRARKDRELGSVETQYHATHYRGFSARNAALII